MSKRNSASRNKITPPDALLLFSIATLLLLGVIMVTSASVAIAEQETGNPFHYGIRQGIAVILGLALSVMAYCTPTEQWKRAAKPCCLIGLGLLLLVLIPGIGLTVNGSSRWLPMGFMTFQASEWVKWSFILYLAYTIDENHQALQEELGAFLKPLFWLAGIVLLLLAEPDFGAASVITITTLAMLFMARVPLKRFMGLAFLVGMGLVGLAVSAPYRLARLTSFLDPWADQFDSGYQLTQALIAFGRGEWFGVGLGGSIQKLFYLPEAFSDFLFAILAEELGLLGAIGVLGLYALLIVRGFLISQAAMKIRERFSAYLAFGLTFWLGCQALINIGVNAGVLPTKGLTLPFMSAGGSSILICCLAAGILLRVQREITEKNQKGRYTL